MARPKLSRSIIKPSIDSKRIVELREKYGLTFSQIAKRFGSEYSQQQFRNMYDDEKKCQSGQTHI